MSGESDEHASLVANLAGTVKKQHGLAGNLALYLDDGQKERERPQRIGGHLPDLYAENVPRTFVVIGEAKTQTDLMTPRSQRQISAFLHYLRLHEQAFFYLAVPIFCKPTAVSLLRELECTQGSVITQILPIVADY